MRALFSALVLAMCLVCIGCGHTDRQRPPSSESSLTARTAISAVAPIGAKSLPQDEDDDDLPGEAVGHDPHDSDVDGDDDRAKPLGYYDRDDVSTRDYGQPADTKDKRALTFLTRRYYAAASRSDGATACSLLAPAFAKTIPGTYGHGSAGPSYLRETGTCPAVLTLLFQHVHRQVSTQIEVVRVRVDGDNGLVLIGGPNMQASYLEALREGSQWRFLGMLTTVLP